MTVTSVLTALAVSVAVTFALRALPFAAFRHRPMPPVLCRLGRLLPPAIMAVLVVYCLKDVPADPSGSGAAGLMAAALVAVSYRLKHSTFFSITLGTLVYMLLIRLL